MCNTKAIKEGWGTCWVADMEGKMMRDRIGLQTGIRTQNSRDSGLF